MKTREELIDVLNEIDAELASNNKSALLRIVGGSAAILNGIEEVATDDIDTCVKLSEDVKMSIAWSGVDLNDESGQYIDEYMKYEFEMLDENFSNIQVLYLTLPGVVATKMQNENEDKLLDLAEIIKKIDGVELTKESIVNYLEENDAMIDMYFINNFLEVYNEFYINWEA